MRRRYASTTIVPIAQSRGDIDKLLRHWGADSIQWTDQFSSDRVTLSVSAKHLSAAAAAAQQLQAAHIEEVRTELESGYYLVDHEAIADAIVAEELGEL